VKNQKSIFIIISILNLVFGMETYSQSNSVNVHGGYAYQNGEGTNLAVSYAQKMSKAWSWKIQVGISNTYSRTFHDSGGSRPEIASFMDIRRMRQEAELVDIYLDPEFVEAYEGQGLALIEKSPTTYSNRYFVNFGIDYYYAQRSKWFFIVGLGVGLGIADNVRVIGGGNRPYGSELNDVLEGIVISENFRNFYDNQRMVKYLFFNNLLDHKIAFAINERLLVFQYIGYNYDFLAATGLGDERLNLGTAGVVHVNFGIQINL